MSLWTDELPDCPICGSARQSWVSRVDKAAALAAAEQQQQQQRQQQ